MEDRKLPHLSLMFHFAKKQGNAYMWFSIPGGLITGQPITQHEYNAALFPDDPGPGEESVSDQQLFPIKDVILEITNKDGAPKRFHVAMIDGALVAAYGIYDPKTSAL
jgi:hypothetical protein